MKLSKTHISWILGTCALVFLVFLYTILKFDFFSRGLLSFLILVPAVAFFYFSKEDEFNGELTLSDSNNVAIESMSKYVQPSLKILSILGLSILIMALARPQEKEVPEEILKEGIDIILSLDVSLSMLAKDFEPNRLEVSKKLAKEFVLERENDRIGVVIYAGESFPRVPLTTDKGLVINAISEINNGRVVNGELIDQKLRGGTAIGMGLASAVNRLRDSNSKSKVVILMSDGENNQGRFTPEDATELAKAYGVTVYTIGIGSEGTALFPANGGFGKIIFTEQPVNIDEKLLFEIAEYTGGKYFRATSSEKLKEIYAEIDKLEKTKFEETIIKTKADVYWEFLLVGLVLLVGVFLLKHTAFRSVFS